MHRNYYAIIPADVRYDKKLPANAKLLYGEITALCNEKGYCWAGNSYFSELYGVSDRTIRLWMNSLEKNGYINRKLIRNESKQVEQRIIKISTGKKIPGGTEENFLPLGKKIPGGTEENFRNNNTDINNTFNKRSHKRVYDESSIYYTLASRLYERILENNPNHKKPNLQKWANDVRLMIERDKRTEKQITYLIDWCQNDNFWKANILSTGKLREKFDQLVMQIKSKREEEQPKRPKVYVYDINAGED